MLVSLQDVIGIIQTLELPLTVFGGYFVFKRISKSKEVREWIGLLKELLVEMREHNKNGKAQTLPEAADHKA